MKDRHAAPPRLSPPPPHPPPPLSNWIFNARTALRLPFSVCSECAFLILGPQYTGGVKGREIMNCADMEVTSACTKTLRWNWMLLIEAFCPKPLLSRVGEITVDVVWQRPPALSQHVNRQQSNQGEKKTVSTNDPVSLSLLTHPPSLCVRACLRHHSHLKGRPSVSGT